MVLPEYLGGITLLTKKVGMFDQNFFSDYDDNFNKRLIFVKMVYLFQSLTGISLGYNFVWHINGPYSKAVNGIGYIFKEKEQEYSDEISSRNIKFVGEDINQKTEKYSMKIKNFLDKPELMEIAASLEYIRQENQIENEVLINRLIEIKPKFSDKRNLIMEAIHILNDIKNALQS
ncbi:hypothetical protein HYX02_07435 [Candidatus Woesearchaeota archaeon]|nr:hypothetical protein [Candidatus Woesearchaeota archaeon]